MQTRDQKLHQKISSSTTKFGLFGEIIWGDYLWRFFLEQKTAKSQPSVGQSWLSELSY